MGITHEQYMILLDSKKTLVEKVVGLLDPNLVDEAESIVDLYLCEILNEVNKLNEQNG